MTFLRGPNKVLRAFCATGAGFCMALLFGIVFVNSLRRYTIGKSFEWGEELPIYLGIYGMMLGAAYAYLQDRHIRFAILVDLLPVRAHRLIFALVDLLVAATGGLLAYSGYLFVIRRGAVESSGLIGNLRRAAEQTGQEWLEVFGHMGFWQTAMIAGGLLIGLAGVLKFIERIGPAAKGEG